jgi:hypothetical protein
MGPLSLYCEFDRWMLMDEACLVHHKSVAGKVPFCTHSVISCSVFFRRKNNFYVVWMLQERMHARTHTHTRIPSPLQTRTNVLHVSVRLVIILQTPTLQTPTLQTRHRSSQTNTDTFPWCVKETDSVSERIIQLHTEIGRNTLYRHCSMF